jgi:hypothetical protein
MKASRGLSAGYTERRWTMFSFIKYLPLILQFKQVAEAYEEEKGKEKPFYLTRRFIGALIAAVGAVAAYFGGVTISPEILDEITKNIETVAATGVTLYGLIMAVIGLFGKKKVEVK